MDKKRPIIKIRSLIALFLIVSLLIIILPANVMAAIILEPTTTWNVMPILKSYPADRIAPAGSTMFADQFPNLTGTVGTFTNTYLVDGQTVTVTMTTYADNKFDFHVTGGEMTAIFVKGGGDTYLLYQYDPPVPGATNTGPVTDDTSLHDGLNQQQGTFQTVSHIDLCLIATEKPYEPPPVVPSMTFWGMLITALGMVALMSLYLVRRKA